MTNDVVAEPSQKRSKDMDQGNRKRSAPKDAEEELTKKRIRAPEEEPLPEAAEGEHAHSGQRSEDVEELDGSLHGNVAEQAQGPVDNNEAVLLEGIDVTEASAPVEDVACPPTEQKQEDPVLAPAADAATDAAPAVDASGPPGPPPQPSKQYTEVKEALINNIEAPPSAIPSPPWSGFTDHLGEGIRTRLLALATLHLTESGAARCPDAVRQLNANSNRILLGAAPNCELYQERVVRALAHQVGARFLVADSTALHFEDLPPSSKYSSSDADNAAGTIFDSSGMMLAGPGALVRSLGGYCTSEEDDDEMDGGIDEDPFMKPPPKKFGRNVIDKRPSSSLAKKTQQMFLDEMEARQKSREKEREALEKKTEAFKIKIAADYDEQLKSIKGDKPGEEKKEDQEEKNEEVKEEKKEGNNDAAKEKVKKVDEDVKPTDADVGASGSAPPLPKSAEDAIAYKDALIGYLKGRVEELKAKQKFAEEQLAALVKRQSQLGDADNEEEVAVIKRELSSLKILVKDMGEEIFSYEKLGTRAPAAAQKADKPAEATVKEATSAYDRGPGPDEQEIDLGDHTLVTGKFNGKPYGIREKAMLLARRGGGAGAGGGGRAAYDMEAAMKYKEMAAKAMYDAKYKGSDAKKEAGSSSVFKQGDRVCFSGSATDAPPALAIHSEDRERAARNSLSAYLSISWMERREATKRKHAAAAAAAAASASASEQPAASDDGTNPPACSFGRVLNVSNDNTVDVVMDYPFSGGKTFSNQPEKCGFTCPASDLSLVDDRDDAIDASFRALFDILTSELGDSSSLTTPLIVFLPNIDRMIRTHDADTFRRLKERLSSLPARCLFIGGYCTRSLAKEKSSSGPSGLSMLFGGGGSSGRGGSDSLGIGSGDDLPMPWYDRFGGGGGGGSGRMSRSRGNVKGRAFAAMFPNTVELHPPHADGAAKAWKKMLDQDIAAMREKANRAALMKALERCDVVCEDMQAVKVTELALSKKEVEQVVGAAVASALIEPPAIIEPEAVAVEVLEDVVDAVEAIGTGEKTEEIDAKSKIKLAISSVHLVAAAASIQNLRSEAALAPERSSLKDLNTDQYERQLLSEVVPPEEIAVGFNDIGALDAVKNTLHEVVILPLQRPELFTRGALTRPTKGLLLFGPPGTGKTMLAKAVASESGAHFININMSAITSKWLGEGERLVRAVFSLAHKLAPSVIFIDEIDSFLAKRGGHSNEHEALRKMKTEFLAGWDGLRTKQTDRVLVLAATNRPMDLDDAAIRRMPRRIFVPLPDASNREVILRTILKDEEVDKNLDFVELGRETDGYSGSDLKNLCIAAAYCPLRELLEAEKKRMINKDTATATTSAAAELPPVRSITIADFTAAMKQVTPSTHAESASTSELQKWNEQFGEGGSRRAEPLVYYT